MDEEKRYVDFIDVISEGTKHMWELYQKEYGEIKGIPTGLNDVDRILGALRKKDLILLASRPGMGKTTWVLDVARRVAESNKVLFFSVDMTNAKLGEKLFTMNSYVTPEGIQNRDYPREFLEAIFDFEYLSSIDMAVSRAYTPAEIKKECQHYKHERSGLDLVVIDYLQLLCMDCYGTDQRKAEVAAIIKSLKTMAEELDCPVLLLSQLSREPDQREYDHMPRLSDISDYDRIKQDIDVVIFLYRDDYYSPESRSTKTGDSKTGTCIVNVAKNRNGSTGIAKLHWSPRYQHYY